ncbi:unnamed protein product [Euphydryas editha]|uniref:Uncharacterized protein n=1 Tax=Euphydryas editha TaxID=104508 RepID=A0AAU9TAJ1_EUPED|nr:unnamed protein product [Euphydryas editha]
MQAKTMLLFCLQAFFAKTIYSQCIGNSYNEGFAWSGAPLSAPWAEPNVPCASELAPFAPLAASNGRGFIVKSVSPIAVTGVTMTSENAYEGNLAVTGALPFLGAVALEGTLPTLGAGDVKYGCGNGNVEMLSEDVTGYNNIAGPYGFGQAELGYGYGAGLRGQYGPGVRGCGLA